MKKKVTSLLLIMGIFLGMITTGMPVVADKPMVYGAEMEEGDEIEGGYKVQLDGVTYLVCPLEGYVKVSNCGEDRSQINIADEVDGYPVTHIGAQSFWYRRQFSSIVVPESVKVIESSAFNNSIGLQNISLPEGLLTIDDGAFNSCSSLTEIEIPSTVTEIGVAAFNDCGRLGKIVFSGPAPEIQEAAFARVTANVYYPADDTTWTDEVKQNYDGTLTWKIDESTVKPNPELTYTITNGQVTITGYTGRDAEIVIPTKIDGYPVTTVGESAFQDCTSLTRVVLPEGLTTIDSAAFMGCSALISIEIPETVTSIRGSSFSGCSSLEGVTIPDGVTIIQGGTFAYCIGLESLIIPQSVKDIVDFAFNQSGLKEIYFEGNAPSFGTSVFNLVEATAYYPAGNATWTESKMQNYGGTITWVPYGDVSGFALSGSVKSYAEDTATVTLELVNGDGEVEKTATVTGNSTTYNFADVAEGTYTLRVSKANHVTRSYEIVVGTADLTQDVTLLPVGDITGDGKVTATDYSRLLAHVKKTGSIQDEYMLLSADVTGDGKITATDYSRLLAHVKKVSPLW